MIEKVHDEMIYSGIGNQYYTMKRVWKIENLKEKLENFILNCQKCKSPRSQHGKILNGLEGKKMFEKFSSDIYGSFRLEKFQETGKPFCCASQIFSVDLLE